MAQRITSTIPDDLHERLQVVKEGINVSGVCQRAIYLAIQIEEIKARTDIPSMEKALARLSKEKQNTSAKWKQTGFIEGVEDATEKLSYKELKYIGEGGDINKSMRGGNYEPPISGWIEHLNCEKYDEEEDFEFDIYISGWVDGVTHVWKELKDQL